MSTFAPTEMPPLKARKALVPPWPANGVAPESTTGLKLALAPGLERRTSDPANSRMTASMLYRPKDSNARFVPVMSPSSAKTSMSPPVA
jgi:hypothetical protein